jgi:hypothetical protein
VRVRSRARAIDLNVIARRRVTGREASGARTPPAPWAAPAERPPYCQQRGCGGDRDGQLPRKLLQARRGGGAGGGRLRHGGPPTKKRGQTCARGAWESGLLLEGAAPGATCCGGPRSNWACRSGHARARPVACCAPRDGRAARRRSQTRCLPRGYRRIATDSHLHDRRGGYARRGASGERGRVSLDCRCRVARLGAATS